MRAEVGDRTELQHINPHSSGHNSVSFLFSHAAQPGAWGPSFSGCWFSLPHLISNSLHFLCTELYNSSTPTFFLWASQIALNQPVHCQGYILIFLDRMPCYLDRCISYLDSPARSEVNIQQKFLSLFIMDSSLLRFSLFFVCLLFSFFFSCFFIYNNSLSGLIKSLTLYSPLYSYEILFFLFSLSFSLLS